MKKYLVKALALVLVFCMVMPVMAMAANDKTTYIVVSIEDDEGTTVEKPYRVKLTGESSHYLTEDAPLLAEVVAIINEFYTNGDPSTPMYRFQSPAMKDIMDEGLRAYRTSDDSKWEEYVDKYYRDVDPIAGDVALKDVLKDKTSTLGDVVPNVDQKICFENTVKGDPKYGVVYTVTVTRYADGEGTSEKPQLNKVDHFAYITGYVDGTVGPLKNITREEATAIFYRLLDDASREKYETSDCAFTDVKENSWARNEIATMAAAGIITGKGDGTTFDPYASITRAEFATIAARFDELTYEGEDLFPDIVGNWAVDYINQAAFKGWVKGDNGLFRPDDPITRAEAVTIINRMLERQPETEEDLLENMITFTDNMDVDAWYYLAIKEAANGHEYVRKDNGIHESWTSLTDSGVEE